MNRDALNPKSPYLVIDEREADGVGGQIDTVTIFLTASECPIGCSMCDLHHNTLRSATPSGAIPVQMDEALKSRHRGGWLKLYNSGNFFDPRSIPPSDYPAIAERCRGFSRLIVENHPRFGSQRLRQFQQLIDMPLEVAVGLETVQPRWLARLGKKMSRDDFDRYARLLRGNGIDLRVFLIVGAPGLSVAEAIRWTKLSVRHAIGCGARHISLIPARSGHGWNGRANELPEFGLGALADLQHDAIHDAKGRAVVTIDLWDVDRDTEGFQVLNDANLTQRAA